MPWESNKDRKYIYKFPPLIGWNPDGEIVTVGDGYLYKALNVRFKDGRIIPRHQWTELYAGSYGITGLFSFNQGGTNTKLLATKFDTDDSVTGTLELYNTAGSTWSIVDRYRANATPSFATFQKLDGNDVVVCVDGSNDNLRWGCDTSEDPIELGCKKIFDGQETDWSSTDTTYVRRGTRSGKIVGDADGTTQTIEFSNTIVHEQGGISTWAHSDGWPTAGLPYITNNNAVVSLFDKYQEYAIAIRSSTYPITFDTIKVHLEVGHSGTLSGNVVLQVETRTSGLPSGTAYTGGTNTTAISSLVDGENTFTLASPITISEDAWVTFKCDTESTVSDYPYIAFYYNNSAFVSRTVYRNASDGTWTVYSSLDPFLKLSLASDSANSLDLSTGFNAYDELVLDMYIGVVGNLDITDTTGSYIKFTSTDADTNTFFLHHANDDATLASGWNTLVINKSHGDWNDSSSGWADADWGTIEKLEIFIKRAAATNVTCYFDGFYCRHTKPTGASNAYGVTGGHVGSQERCPLGKYACASPNGDRLLIANTELIDDAASGPQFVFFSQAYDIDRFGVNNYIAMPEAITGIISHGGVVHVFSEDKRWILKPTYNSIVPFAVELALGPGTVSHHTLSIGKYKGSEGVYFLASDGVYFCAGTEFVKVSDKIDTLFKTLSTGEYWDGYELDKTNWSYFRGVVYDGDYHLYCYTTTPATYGYLVCDGDTGEWTLDSFSTGWNTASRLCTALAVGDDSTGQKRILQGDATGDIFSLGITQEEEISEASATVHTEIETGYLGLMTGVDLSWETMFLWTKSYTNDETTITITCYGIESDESGFNNWDDDSTNSITVTYTFTPEQYKWQRHKIPLVATASEAHMRARAVNFKIVVGSGKRMEMILEKVVARGGNEENE